MISKKIADYLPTITISIILLGFYEHYLYYSLFGIEIYNFMDVSEIIFAFSSIYLYAVLMIVIVFVLFIALILFKLPLSFFFDYSKAEQNYKDRKDSLKTSKYGIVLKRFTVFLGIVCALGQIFSPLFRYNYISEQWTLFGFIGLALFLMVAIHDRFPQDVKEMDGSDIAIILVAFIFCLLTYRSYSRHLNVVNGNPTATVNLLMKDGARFISEQKLLSISKTKTYLIGSSKNYYFFWEDIGIVKIIPINEIKDIELTPIHESFYRRKEVESSDQSD